jgi:dTDP-4-dehydrorhamnose reductase
VSADPIDKDLLLRELARRMKWGIEMRSVAEPVIDRSLDSTRFRQRTGWEPPTWAEMLTGLAEEKA